MIGSLQTILGNFCFDLIFQGESIIVNPIYLILTQNLLQFIFFCKLKTTSDAKIYINTFLQIFRNHGVSNIFVRRGQYYFKLKYLILNLMNSTNRKITRVKKYKMIKFLNARNCWQHIMNHNFQCLILKTRIHHYTRVFLHTFTQTQQIRE